MPLPPYFTGFAAGFFAAFFPVSLSFFAVGLALEDLGALAGFSAVGLGTSAGAGFSPFAAAFFAGDFSSLRRNTPPNGGMRRDTEQSRP